MENFRVAASARLRAADSLFRAQFAKKPPRARGGASCGNFAPGGCGRRPPAAVSPDIAPRKRRASGGATEAQPTDQPSAPGGRFFDAHPLPRAAESAKKMLTSHHDIVFHDIISAAVRLRRLGLSLGSTSCRRFEALARSTASTAVRLERRPRVRALQPARGGARTVRPCCPWSPRHAARRHHLRRATASRTLHPHFEARIDRHARACAALCPRPRVSVLSNANAALHRPERPPGRRRVRQHIQARPRPSTHPCGASTSPKNPA